MVFFQSLQMLYTHGQPTDITYWCPKYAIYNETSSVDYLCKLSGAATVLTLKKEA